MEGTGLEGEGREKPEYFYPSLPVSKALALSPAPTGSFHLEHPLSLPLHPRGGGSFLLLLISRLLQLSSFGFFVFPSLVEPILSIKVSLLKYFKWFLFPFFDLDWLVLVLLVLRYLDKRFFLILDAPLESHFIGFFSLKGENSMLLT